MRRTVFSRLHGGMMTGQVLASGSENGGRRRWGAIPKHNVGKSPKTETPMRLMFFYWGGQTDAEPAGEGSAREKNKGDT